MRDEKKKDRLLGETKFGTNSGIFSIKDTVKTPSIGSFLWRSRLYMDRPSFYAQF